MSDGKYNSQPVAVIFDWDNTLVECWEKIAFALNAAFEHFEMPIWSLKQVQDNAHHSTKDSFPVLFGDKAAEASKVFYQAYHKSKIQPKPLENAEKVLKILLQNEIYCAIVSNKKGEILRREVSSHGWDDFFVTKIGSTDCMEDKPSIIPVHAALNDNEFPRERIWFVGDTKVDIQCARNFGCKAISFGENEQLDSDLHFKNHDLLAKHLQNHM